MLVLGTCHLADSIYKIKKEKRMKPYLSDRKRNLFLEKYTADTPSPATEEL